MEAVDIARLRMYGQHLWGSPLTTPEDVVRWLVAVQAQEFQVAKWSVAQRARDVTDAEVYRAFADGAILRTHVLRPTWHLVLPEDIRWLLDLTAPRVNALNAHYYRKLELDEELLGRTDAVLAAALEGGRNATRTELAAELDRAGIHATGMRLGYIVMRAELDGIVCSGPMRGKQHTYASLGERAPRARILGRDEALEELTLRGVEILGPRLEHEVVDGRTYRFASVPPDAGPMPGRIDLVPGYDEVIMSYGESKDVLAPTPTDAAFRHAILLGGRLIGHWRLVRGTDPVFVETSLRRLDPDEERALDAAVERIGRFLGTPVALLADGSGSPAPRRWAKMGR
jgi:winged helix DNA-binding protein